MFEFKSNCNCEKRLFLKKDTKPKKIVLIIKKMQLKGNLNLIIQL